MQVEIFTLCRDARDASGALDIKQAFHELVVPKLPIALPVKAAVRVRYDVREGDTHTLSIRGVDLSGAEVCKTAEAKFPVEAEAGAANAWVRAVFDLGQLTIREAGEIRFDLIENKSSHLSIWLSVRVASQHA